MGQYLGVDRPLESPSVFPDLLHSGFEFVARNGWFLLIGVVVLFLLWRRVSSHLYDLYDNWRESSKKKDPDVLLSQQDAIIASRERLQNMVIQDSQSAEERRKDLEKRRSEERSEKWEGHRLGKRLNNNKEPSRKSQKPNDKPGKPKPYRNEYNPLMGSGGGAGFTPRRRFPQQGG